MTQHPAGPDIGTGVSAVWYGPEVEGVHARDRISTAFVDRMVTAVDELQELQARLRSGRVRHLFLTERFTAHDWAASELLPGFKGHLTIACDEGDVEDRLSWPIAWRGRLMVRANMRAPWIALLRATDMVTVGQPYDLITWEVREGVRTIPADYRMDRDR